MISSRIYAAIIFGACLVLWFAVHVPAIFYGTQKLPLHQSYVGDEQSPVNGALHVLAEKNLAGLRNLKTLYYGPVFAMAAVPAVGADALVKYLRGAVETPDDYKNFILWDWGGIVWKARTLSIVVGFAGLLALYALLMTKTVNPAGDWRLAVLGTVLLAGNFYYFEYASFFKHWIFLITGLLWQLYFAVRIEEDHGRAPRYFAYQAVLFFLTFGVSYVSAFSQLLFLPLLIVWVRRKEWKMVRLLVYYGVALAGLVALVIAWHPRAFLRLLGLVGGDVTNTDTSQWSSEVQAVGYSFSYYGRILFVNHIPLLGLWGILAIIALRSRITRGYVWMLPLVPAVVWYAFFGYMSHHESRYILPVVVLLIVSTAMLWTRLYADLPFRLQRLGLFLIAATLLFHGASIARWEYTLSKGPPEKGAIAEAVAYQQSHPEAKQLFIQYYLLGHPHTKEAYQDYMNRFGKNDTNLYHVLLETPVPAGVTELNAYYLRPDAIEGSGDMFGEFSRIVHLHQPAVELKLDPDYLEVALMRLWFADEVENTYTVLKEL